MASNLALRQYIPLPPHPEGDYDHGDVCLESGHVYVANTAAGTVEVIDGEHLRHLTTIPDCPEASGVLCAQEDALIFAAARGAGKLLVIDPTANVVLRTVAVGHRPNGLAWDGHRKHVLVADVQDNQARLVDQQAGEVMAAVELPGRPRWAIYHQASDRLSAGDPCQVHESSPSPIDRNAQVTPGRFRFSAVLRGGRPARRAGAASIRGGRHPRRTRISARRAVPGPGHVR